MKTTKNINVNLTSNKENFKFVTTRDLPVPDIVPPKKRVGSKMVVTTHDMEDANKLEENKEWKEKTAVIKKQRKEAKKKTDAQDRMAKARAAKVKK